jgi:hypothetical protein
LKSKKKKEKPSPCPVGPNLGPTPATPPPLAPALLLSRPTPGLPPRARQPAPHSASLSLTSQPHLPAALSRTLASAGRPAPPVSRFVILPAYDAPPSPHRRPFTAVSSPPSPRRTERVRHRPVLPPLTNVLAGTAPPWRLIGGAVRHLWPTLCSSSESGRSTAPLPPRAYKKLPRAPSSSHRPRPLPSSPRPSPIREAPPSSPSPVSSSPSSLSLSVGPASD